MVSLMTALYLWDLQAEDRVAVKPHASPVLHAIEYLLGRLDRALPDASSGNSAGSSPTRAGRRIRSRSTTRPARSGSGAAAPLFGALANRYVETHFGSGTGGRFISLLGDAELDEGNVWEALLEPQTRGARQRALDRRPEPPEPRPGRPDHQGATSSRVSSRRHGWQVLELKYGRRLREAYARDGGDLLRRRIDEMPNQLYQSLFGASEEVVDRGAPARPRSGRAQARSSGSSPDYARRGGDADPRSRRPRPRRSARRARADARQETDRPTIALRLHDQGLRPADRRPAAEPLRAADAASRWTSCARRRADARRPSGTASTRRARRGGCAPPRAPASSGRAAEPARRSPCRRAISLARPGGDLDPGGRRADPARPLADSTELAERIVTVSPDVSVSTNLGGWINKVGVFGLGRGARRTRSRRPRRSRGGCRRPGATSSSASRR